MSEAVFKHYDLKLVEPTFDSALTDLIIELDHLRKKQLGGSTHPKFIDWQNVACTEFSPGFANPHNNDFDQKACDGSFN